MPRSAVIILQDDHVALIERVRDGQIYYLFPGGTIEADETAEAAAVREAYEELGVHVTLGALATVVTFCHDRQQYYYHASINTGQFGSGSGEEFSSPAASPRGSYRAVWLARRDLAQHDVRPQALAQALYADSLTQQRQPLRIHEEG